MMADPSISQSYQNLPPKHKVFLWALVAVAIWGQALFVFGLIATFAIPNPHSATILESYQSLPPNHRAYLWMLVFITLWSQVIIIAGGWLRKLIKRENMRLKRENMRLKEEVAKIAK
jgi:hypothetical protein